MGAIILLIGTSLGASMFFPLKMPADMVNMLTDILSNLWAWNGILPIEAVVYSVFYLLQIVLYWFAFKLIMLLIGGSGDIE